MKKIVSLSLALTFLASPAAAKVVDDALAKKTLKDQKDGSSKKLTLGFTGSANSSSNVVGAIDGTTMQIGLLLQGEVKRYWGKHGWETEAKLQHAQTRTPVLDAFVKSADVLEVVSTWMYNVSEKPAAGPFARFKLATQLLGSVDIRPTKVTVKKTAIDGTVKTDIADPEIATPTTNAFEPLVMTQTAGLFANPITEKALTLKTKLGAGAQEIVTSGGYSVTGYDKDTATVSLKELETSVQMGAEFELNANGAMSETVGWTAKANFFMPVYSSATARFSGMDALQTDIGATISVKLSSWAKLDYALNIKRLPLVIDEWQIQHGLMLTTGFNLL